MSAKSDGKAWGGEFRVPTDQRVESFSESISFDQRLADYDIDGSIAHSQMLAECWLLTQIEADAIREGLEEIRKDRFAIVVTEVPYQVNKSRLLERIGEVVRDKVVEGISDLRDESDPVSYTHLTLPTNREV